MHFRNFQQRISRMKNSKSSPHLDGVDTDNTLPYTNFQVIEYRCLVKLCFSRSKVPKAKKIWLALMPYLIMLTIHKNITCCCRLQLWMMALLKSMHFVNTCCLVQLNSPNFASLLFFTCAYISWTSFCANRYRKFAYAASKDFASSLLLFFLLNQLLGEAFAFIILQWFNHSIFLGKALFILCDW